MKLLTSVCVCVCVNSPVQNQDAPSLQNVSLSVGSRQLVAVIGPVGAGKVRAPFLALLNPKAVGTGSKISTCHQLMIDFEYLPIV